MGRFEGGGKKDFVLPTIIRIYTNKSIYSLWTGIIHRKIHVLFQLFEKGIADNVNDYSTWYANAVIGKQPVTQSGYELTRALPDNLISSLPGIEELEAELGGMHKEESGDE